MRSNRPLISAALLLAWLLAPAVAVAGEHRLGLGVHFFRTLDDFDDRSLSAIEDDGLSYVLAYQYLPGGVLGFELDFEIHPDGFGGAVDSAFSPVAYVVLGSKLYAAAGIGVTVADTLPDDVSDPFYVARAGYQLTLLPGIRLDLNANYRADAFSGLGDASTDAITLGALVRFNL